MQRSGQSKVFPFSAAGGVGAGISLKPKSICSLHAFMYVQYNNDEMFHVEHSVNLAVGRDRGGCPYPSDFRRWTLIL